MDFIRKNWILVAVAALVVGLVISRKAQADTLAAPIGWIPPAGGTPVPGTVPVASASLALPQQVVVLPPGATTGPVTAARSGRGHY